MTKYLVQLFSGKVLIQKNMLINNKLILCTITLLRKLIK